MSVVGILRLARKHFINNNYNNNNNKSSSSQEEQEETLAPLIVFVNEIHGKRDDFHKPPAFALFYQLLSDSPWATVSTAWPTPSQGRSNEYHRRMFALTNHSVANHDFWNALHNSREKFRVCFKNAMLYQNCFSCPRIGAGTTMVNPEVDDETESYSFGIWAHGSPSRISLVDEYRRRMDICLRVPPALIKMNPDNKRFVTFSPDDFFRLPSLYFVVRTRTRILRDLPLIYNAIKIGLASSSSSSSVQFYESVNSGEPPARGSRIPYVKKIRESSDVMISLHGGDAAMGVLMPLFGVLVEFAIPHNFCNFGRDDLLAVTTSPASTTSKSTKTTTVPLHWMNRAKRCWLGIIANTSRADHWLYEVPTANMNTFAIPANILADAARDGACRWLMKRYGPQSDDDDESVFNNDTTTTKNHLFQQKSVWRILVEKFEETIAKNRKNNKNNNVSSQTCFRKFKKEQKQMKDGKTKVVDALWKCIELTTTKETKEEGDTRVQHHASSSSFRESSKRLFQIIKRHAPWFESVRNVLVTNFRSATPNDDLDKHFRFLWFSLNPGNVDVFKFKAGREFLERLRNRVIWKISSGARSVAAQLPEFVKCTPISICVNLWTIVFGRLMDRGDMTSDIFGKQEDEADATRRLLGNYNFVGAMTKNKQETSSAADIISLADFSDPKTGEVFVIDKYSGMEFIGCLPLENYVEKDDDEEKRITMIRDLDETHQSCLFVHR